VSSNRRYTADTLTVHGNFTFAGWGPRGEDQSDAPVAGRPKDGGAPRRVIRTTQLSSRREHRCRWPLDSCPAK